MGLNLLQALEVEREEDLTDTIELLRAGSAIFSHAPCRLAVVYAFSFLIIVYTAQNPGNQCLHSSSEQRLFYVHTECWAVVL